MGRRKDSLDESIKAEKNSPPQKIQKKHKRHKRKKAAVIEDDSDASIDVSFDEGPSTKTPFKVKIKMSKDVSANDLLKSSSSKNIEKKSPTSMILATSPKVKKKRGIKGKESGTSSEEERWLDAIESGKLEEVDDELKKIKPKDPKMMTARQRAMYERGTDKEPSPGGEVLMALPSGYKEKVMTAEAIQKAAIKSQKRKQLADEKREKDKQKTMERLLKKQDSKAIKGSNKNKAVKNQVPHISYRNTIDSITLSMPQDIMFPLEKKSYIDPPKPVICGIAECTNLKRYACSQTGIPLCSLDCYKKNLVNIVVS